MVEATQRKPLASALTDSQSPLLSAPRVTSVQAMPFWPRPAAIVRPLLPSFTSATCIEVAAALLRRPVITTL